MCLVTILAILAEMALLLMRIYSVKWDVIILFFC